MNINKLPSKGFRITVISVSEGYEKLHTGIAIGIDIGHQTLIFLYELSVVLLHDIEPVLINSWLAHTTEGTVLM